MPDPLDWISSETERLRAEHLWRSATIRAGGQGREIVIDTTRYLNFGSNDYLGLAADPRLTAAVARVLAAQGWGSGASPLISGRTALHAELERHLAAFEGTEAALLFPSGFAANLGVVTALSDRDDLILSDAKNHASLIDGCRLSRATVQVYPHRDLEQLEAALHRSRSYRRRLIVTDTLFSMDGDCADLPELVELSERFDAMLVVDEAHATGVLGKRGRGLCELDDLHNRVPVRVGTLSKALGSIGGFVVGSRALIDWLFNRARPLVFSTAQPPASCAAALAALRIVRDEPQRRERVLDLARRLRGELQELGWHVGEGYSQIVPVYIGSAERTMALSSELRGAGLFVPGIRPPSVPEGESLLRISLSSLHTDHDIDRLIDFFRGVRQATPGR